MENVHFLKAPNQPFFFENFIIRPTSAKYPVLSSSIRTFFMSSLDPPCWELVCISVLLRSAPALVTGPPVLSVSPVSRNDAAGVVTRLVELVYWSVNCVAEWNAVDLIHLKYQ